jgi:hypothetical protein
MLSLSVELMGSAEIAEACGSSGAAVKSRKGIGACRNENVNGKAKRMRMCSTLDQEVSGK